MNRFYTYFGNISFVLPVAFIAMIGPLRASREAPVAGGLAHLWTNGPTGSYTVLINPEPGLTCVIDMGQSDSLKELSA